MTDLHSSAPTPAVAPERPLEQVGDWSGHLPVESAVVRRHRRAQGEWRTRVLKWPAGEPGTSASRQRYHTLPNYLAAEHAGQTAAEAGQNLMSPAAREYAQRRLSQLKAMQGAAEPDRLYRNLLSSQPLAFSIAGELRAHPEAALAVLRELAGLPATSFETLTGPDSVVPDEQRSSRRYASLETYDLGGIEAEWFPPRWAHTGDKSGFDIAACLGLDDGTRALLSVEVKYTDTFSAKPLAWRRYEAQLEALGLTEDATRDLVKAGCSQVLRQVLITASVGRDGLVPGVPESGRVQHVMAAVLARSGDATARRVVETVDAAVSVPVRFWSHEDLFASAQKQEALVDWAHAMTDRYLALAHDPPAHV